MEIGMTANVYLKDGYLSREHSPYVAVAASMFPPSFLSLLSTEVSSTYTEPGVQDLADTIQPADHKLAKSAQLILSCLSSPSPSSNMLLAAFRVSQSAAQHARPLSSSIQLVVLYEHFVA